MFYYKILLVLHCLLPYCAGPAFEFTFTPAADIFQQFFGGEDPFADMFHPFGKTKVLERINQTTSILKNKNKNKNTVLF